MSTSKMTGSQGVEPNGKPNGDRRGASGGEASSEWSCRGGIGARAALADQAMTMGDLAGAEDFVKAIFALCDIAAAVMHPAGAAALPAPKRGRLKSNAEPRRRAGARNGCGAAGPLRDRAAASGTRRPELVL